MEALVVGVQIALGIGGLLATGRAIRGPELADRIVAIDLVLLLLAGGVAVNGAKDGSETLTPLLIVVALMAFAGTILVARFIEWRDVP